MFFFLEMFCLQYLSTISVHFGLLRYHNYFSFKKIFLVVKSDGSLTQPGQLALDIYKALKNAIEVGNEVSRWIALPTYLSSELCFMCNYLQGTIIIVASQRHSFTFQQAIVLVQMALSPSVRSRFVIKVINDVLGQIVYAWVD